MTGALMLAASLLAGAAQTKEAEARWIHVSTDEEGAQSFYDAASIHRREDIVHVQMRAVPGPRAAMTVTEFFAVEEMNCARRTSATVALIASMPGGGRQDVPISGEPDRIRRESPLGAVFAILCPSAGVT